MSQNETEVSPHIPHVSTLPAPETQPALDEGTLERAPTFPARMVPREVTERLLRDDEEPKNKPAAPAVPKGPTLTPHEQRQKACDDAAKKLVNFLDDGKENGPLRTGLIRAFQQAWNKLHRPNKRGRLPENGDLGNQTIVALKKAFRDADAR